MTENDDIVGRNRAAWNTERYASWVTAIGAPETEAQVLMADPANKLRRFSQHLGDVAGLEICNVQGSHARVAVALALLGARATVLDFSQENRRYGLELAAAAGVAIDYRLCDVIEAAQLGLNGRFDWLVMELGILHYHHDLRRFFTVMAGLAKPGGRMLLHEFHPIQRKLLMERSARNYFHAEPVIGEAPNPTGDGRSLGLCSLRFWTLGEVVTTAIGAGWRIDRLEEHPDWDEPTIPGTFTLVATRV